MISQRLRDLDERVFRVGFAEARLQTEDGWRRFTGRWRLLGSLAVGTALLSFLGSMIVTGYFAGMGLVAASLAFQAGMLKAEDDRLHGRGLSRLHCPRD